jgi:hypothetical protein
MDNCYQYAPALRYENLSFSPWNALPEHRPIGQRNRTRKEVYEASSKYRHENNFTDVPVRLNW